MSLIEKVNVINKQVFSHLACLWLCHAEAAGLSGHCHTREWLELHILVALSEALWQERENSRRAAEPLSGYKRSSFHICCSSMLFLTVYH